MIAFGPGNTVYYGNIVFSRGAPAAGGTEAPNGIVVSVSHDGGAHRDRPTIIQLDGVDAQGTATPTTFFNDKIWLAADRRSGRVYVTWTRFADTPDGTTTATGATPPTVSRSGPTGTPSWPARAAAGPGPCG